MKMIISAGGTGGHIYPAISIINKFKAKEKVLDILYIGTHNRMEKDIIPNMGIKYEELEIYGFSKTNIKRDFKNIFLCQKAYHKCLKIMDEFKPDVVIGVGGYVTMPVIKAAKKRKIKTVIHEQNSIPGKTNFLTGNIDLACVSYENSSKYFKKAKKVVYTGNPTGENALTCQNIPKKSLGLSDDKKLLVIVSGSLGSGTLNTFFAKFLSLVDVKDDFEVLYITGQNYYDEFVKDKVFSSNVKIASFVNGLSGLLQNTDLVISRAGAGTIAEILALELPSILIPSPYVANNHQYYNALDVSSKGLAILKNENELNETAMYDLVKGLLSENDEYKKLKENLKNTDMKNASEVIYNEIKELLNE